MTRTRPTSAETPTRLSPRRPSALELCLALSVSSLILAACGGGEQGAPKALGLREGPSHPMVGRAAPDFLADPLMEGKWLPLSSLRDRPVALLFFRLGTPFAPELAREFGRLHTEGTFAPTLFAGVARGSSDEIWSWVRKDDVSLPILRDTGTIARTYAIGDLPTVVLMDADHIVRFRLDGYLGREFRPRLEATVAALRLLIQAQSPTPFHLELSYGKSPRAPVFTARDLDGRPVDLAGLRGKTVVLYFFDQDCPNCKRDLSQLTPVLREFRSRGVAAIGITSRDIDGDLRDFMKEHGIDHPVVLDHDRAETAPP
jgi:peroxiredoxin